MAAVHNVLFARNFGGRATVSQYQRIDAYDEKGNTLFTVVQPSEIRRREDGTVTIYSRKHRSTSVYGQYVGKRMFVGVERNGSHVSLNL